MLKYLRMLRRGSLTLSCEDSFTNAEMYALALDLIYSKTGYFNEYDASVDQCNAQEIRIREARKEFASHSSKRLRGRLRHWLNYYDGRLRYARRKFRRVDGVWMKEQDRVSALRKCLGV